MRFKRNILWVLLLLTLGWLLVITRQVRLHRDRAERSFWLDCEISVASAVRTYFEFSPGCFEPDVAEMIMADQIAEFWTDRLRTKSREQYRFIPLGANPEPGTFTILFRYPKESLVDQSQLPVSWETAVVYYGSKKSMYREYPSLDLNRDGYADPVRSFLLQGLHYGEWETDPVGCGFYASDPDERWIVRDCLHGDLDDYLIPMLLDNGYNYPPDEPLPELPRNWWK